MNKYALAITFLLNLIVCDSVWACQCFAFNSPQEAAEYSFENAESVFRGKLIYFSRKVRDETSDSYALFEVKKFFKGSGNRQLRIETRYSAEACGLGFQFEKSIGEQFLVFVTNIKGGGKYVSRCSATQVTSSVSKEVWTAISRLEEGASITKKST